MNRHTLHNVLNMKQRVQHLNTTGIINEECSTYVHAYMNMKVYERAVHRQAHTHTDAFITSNPSQQQRCYKAAAGHQRYSGLPQFGGQHFTGIGGQFLRAEEKHLIIKEQVTNLQFRTVQVVCIISLYFSTAVVLQGY